MIGYLASLCVLLADIPLVIKVLKTKDAESVSILTYIIKSLSMICWIIYGLQHEDGSYIYGNLISLMFGMIIIFYKLKQVKTG